MKNPAAQLDGMNFAAMFAALALTTIGGCAPKKTPPPPPVPLVAVTGAIKRDIPVYLDEIGSCTAMEVVSIRPQASGAITEIKFTDGVDVKAGDPLFTIDPRPYLAALHLAEASLAQSRAALMLAQQDYSRVEKLLGNKAVSQEDYDTRKNAVAVAQAQVQAGEAAVETAQVNQSYCYISSPIEGRTSMRLVDIGNVVTANSATSLLVIQRLDPIYADFTVTERNLADVRKNMADGTLKTIVSIPGSGATASREGSLTFLDNAVQDSTGTVKLRATLENKDRLFWPGQFVRIRLVLRTEKDAVLVPISATQTSQKGPYVFVVTPDSKADFRQVKLGQRHDNLVVISEGLTGDERVVTSGQLALTPGVVVRIQDAAHPSAPASAQATAVAERAPAEGARP